MEKLSGISNYRVDIVNKTRTRMTTSISSEALNIYRIDAYM